ncbi:tyrosine-type recombinase/integrase [Sulfitobacter faviae]|uniref:tyrosine-type recombinase/integrase n=1 Tax=Sulfitobacter faviae TaxID=1775881 RepID=UPI002458C199|nr:tyrosine-type recombinase/integrase [Sulfitobacter faviae]
MIHHHVDRFVQFNRTLGKKFTAQEVSLRAFADFAAERSITHLTAAPILEWAGGAATPDAAQARFDRARALAVFLHAEDAQHEIPAIGLLGRSRRRRPAPHILTRDQINRIMQEALLVPGLSPISPLTYHNLFGLLASTGLRISEALSLQRGDLTEDGLMIRKGKFGKTRLVPIHASTRAALDRYLEARNSLRKVGDALFVLGHGRPRRRRGSTWFSCGSCASSAIATQRVPVPGCTICAIPSPCDRWRPAGTTRRRCCGT